MLLGGIAHSKIPVLRYGSQPMYPDSSNREVAAYVHGVRLVLDSENSDLQEQFLEDFAISPPSEPTAALRLVLGSTHERPGNWIPWFVTKASTLYLPNPFSPEKRISFFKSVWVRYSPSRGTAFIYGDRRDALYEVASMVAQSFLGEQFDKRGWHRLHALGIVVGREASLLMGPSGRGKSTLAWHFLGNTRVKLLGDDLPWIHRSGEVRGFPQRIALRCPPPVPREFVRIVRRECYGSKYVLSRRFFEDRIASVSPVRHLILLSKGLGNGPARCHRISRVSLILPLLKWLVVGFETPQIWQLYLRGSVFAVLRGIRTVFSRLHTALALLVNSTCWRLELSSAPEADATLVVRTLEKRLQENYEVTHPSRPQWAGAPIPEML